MRELIDDGMGIIAIFCTFEYHEKQLTRYQTEDRAHRFCIENKL